MSASHLSFPVRARLRARGVGIVLSLVLAIVVVILLFLTMFTVNTAQVAVITRFGKFRRVAADGLNWKWPIIDTIAGRVSLRVNQIKLTMETKSLDNVFVSIPISVQTRVRSEAVYDAFYKLSDPVAQIQSYLLAHQYEGLIKKSKLRERRK